VPGCAPAVVAAKLNSRLVVPNKLFWAVALEREKNINPNNANLENTFKLLAMSLEFKPNSITI
jgi:hypothetical protein